VPPPPSALRVGNARPLPTPLRCKEDGWHLIPLLPAGCEGICVADDPAKALPSLTWSARADLCPDCTALDTPWATTDAERQNAVDGVFRAFGPGPTRFRLGMPKSDGGVLGIYSESGSPLVGYRVKIQPDAEEPCGRIASAKFSADGDFGAHISAMLTDPQDLFVADADATARLLTRPPTFVWTREVMQGLGINDMWFSRQLAVADVSGVLWLGNYDTRQATRVSDLEAAPAGQYSTAQVVGSTAFLAHEGAGFTEWLVARDGRVSPFLGDAGHDIAALATDGASIVWVEGNDPMPTNKPDAPLRFNSHHLSGADYTTDAAQLRPRVLLENAPAGLSYLTIANGYVAGIYLVDTKAYRASAVVVRLKDGKAFEANLPSGYGWGYEVYPAATALLGPIGKSAMLKFETVLRMPFSAMKAL
jgi:hypothetical protein